MNFPVNIEPSCTTVASSRIGLTGFCAGLLVLTASDQVRVPIGISCPIVPPFVFRGASGSSGEVKVFPALASTIPSGTVSHEESTAWVENALLSGGFRVKRKTKTASGSYLLRLGEGRSVDVFPSGEVVLAFVENEKDHIYEFELHDMRSLVNVLRNGSSGFAV